MVTHCRLDDDNTRLENENSTVTLFNTVTLFLKTQFPKVKVT